MTTPAEKLTRPIALTPSKRLLQLTTLGHLFATVAVVSSGLPLLLPYSLMIAVSCHYIYSLYQWRHWPNLQLYYHSDQWFLTREYSKQPLYTVLRCSYWHPWLVVLEVKNRLNKKNYLPLWADSCEQQEFKRLQLIATTWLHKQPLND